jgi:hypothetical protein
VPVGGGSPSVVASASGPWGIAVDGANVYWTSTLGGVVMRVPVAGGTPFPVATGQSCPQGIAVP